jgi:hypothetical protein
MVGMGEYQVAVAVAEDVLQAPELVVGVVPVVGVK